MRCVFCNREIDGNAKHPDGSDKLVYLEMGVSIQGMIDGEVPNTLKMNGPAHAECAWALYTLVRKLRVACLG